MTALRAPDWSTDGHDWPNREASRFVAAGGLRWHVQVAGSGPALLLLHGTGASTHSFRDLLPLLARRFTVVAPDLPGHGFTTRPTDPSGLSLPGMAASIAALLRALAVAPQVAVGHSAGAAILCRMCLDGSLAPRALVSLNGALLPLPGLRHPAFTPLVRSVVSGDWLPRLFARRMESPSEVERLLARTGSTIDARGRELYARLSRNASHTGAALAMMGHWDTRPLEAGLPQLAVPMLLLVGARDGMILPGVALRVRSLAPRSELLQISGLGHLAHEESPQLVADEIAGYARAQGVAVPS
ncbi:MAG: alpha/beta fold hydrolase BchO [Gammaproteobacteria bacterium]|jgi:magnesium chelatase accessory protein